MTSGHHTRVLPSGHHNHIMTTDHHCHKYCRYLYLRQDTPVSSQVWNSNLQKYIESGQIPDKITSMIQHVKAKHITTIQSQLTYLSSISNYHWWQYVRCDGTKSSGGIHVRLTDHLLYHP